MRASIWMPLRAKKVRPVMTMLTTRVATASNLVCRLNSAHQAAKRAGRFFVETLEGTELLRTRTMLRSA